MEYTYYTRVGSIVTSRLVITRDLTSKVLLSEKDAPDDFIRTWTTVTPDGAPLTPTPVVSPLLSIHYLPPSKDYCSTLEDLRWYGFRSVGRRRECTRFLKITH